MIGLERKLEDGRGSGLARKCWELIKRKEGKGVKSMSSWERERWNVMSEIGEGKQSLEKIVEKWGKKDRENRWRKILESNYNKWYKVVKEEGMPNYLIKIRDESKRNRVLRFRVGEGMNEHKYWMEEDERLCRICKYEKEDWGHVLDRCGREEGHEERSVGERVCSVLSGNGEGERWMKELENKRARVGN